MTIPNLLITGATGFIGFRTLLEALEAGYTISEFTSNKELSFIEVPDILHPEAYTEALKDVTYAIHIASPIPLPFRNPLSEIIDPTVQGAANILEAALKSPSLKRIVITSSIVANMPFPHATENPPLVTAESRVPNLKGGGGESVRVFPGFFYGKDERATDTKSLMSGSNRLVLTIILGTKFDDPRLAGAAHIDDVANVHVLALDKEKAGTQDFGVTTPVVYDNAFDIVKNHFPKEVDEGVFTQGSQPSLPINWNAEKTEEVLGFKFKAYEDMVIDVSKQYLGFSGKVT
ncbi:hypothetical protein EYC80_009208 [Monilinia laxa]|uniref:NAD-dependent epimerase/dehydratase domain-containing protein n=1 Tax=Monilinia laxa TaxID=61186 RepID=A0A5N6JX40_MONLA|nr:hypothetical protein EYC80_009208 [Monilinia laxa]